MSNEIKVMAAILIEKLLIQNLPTLLITPSSSKSDIFTVEEPDYANVSYTSQTFGVFAPKFRIRSVHHILLMLIILVFLIKKIVFLTYHNF
jgi:hypothetical protein